MIFLRRIKVFLFNGILLTITGLIIRSISMFFNVYISNKIGSEAIGVYQLIISVYLFSITIANSGIHLATTRIISEQEAIGMNSNVKSAMKKCLKYSFTTGFIACFLLFTFSPVITSTFLHNKISDIPLKVLAISLPFLSTSSCINGYFTALRKVKKTVFYQLFEEFVKIIVVTILINSVMPEGLEYACISLVVGSCISEILSSIVLFFLFLKDKNYLLSVTNRNENYTRQILRIALPISFTSYIRSGLSTFQQLIIPLQLEKFGLSCEESLSKYGIINGIIMPLIMFPCSLISSFSGLLIPEFSFMNAKHEIKKINFALVRILKYCFIFSFLVMGFFVCFAKNLNDFIYPNIDLSYYIKILSPLIILMYVDNIVDSILKGLDKQLNVMGINIIDLTTSLCFIYFLLPFKGINGYIVVLFISEFLNGILSLRLLIKETSLKIDFVNWIIKPLFSIIFLSIIFSCFNIDSIIDLIIYSFIFIVLYFLLMILSKVFVKN